MSLTRAAITGTLLFLLAPAPLALGQRVDRAVGSYCLARRLEVGIQRVFPRLPSRPFPKQKRSRSSAA